MPETFVDPYIEPSTGVLKNLVGASTNDELKNAEGELVASRTGEFITAMPIKATGSLEDFRLIHRHLFQDVYEWAGKPRTVEIRKNEEGSQFFLPSANIGMGFAWAQEELAKDSFLRGLDAETFSNRLAYHFDNYNFIHPFREGNGRVQRLFWTLLAHDAGYGLDWRAVTGKENDAASRLAAEELDLTGLVAMFSRIINPCDSSAALNEELLSRGHLDDSE